jgi:hypothetical protein
MQKQIWQKFDMDYNVTSVLKYLYRLKSNVGWLVACLLACLLAWLSFCSTTVRLLSDLVIIAPIMKKVIVQKKQKILL